MNSFRWVQGEITPDYQLPELVHIIYASLNFKDVMIASGKLNFDLFVPREHLKYHCLLGFEYVGIDNDSRRIMGIGKDRYVVVLRKFLY